jgi:DNA-directed RNA polymerase subunit RPC12/RpoP
MEPEGSECRSPTKDGQTPKRKYLLAEFTRIRPEALSDEELLGVLHAASGLYFYHRYRCANCGRPIESLCGWADCEKDVKAREDEGRTIDGKARLVWPLEWEDRS